MGSLISSFFILVRSFKIIALVIPLLLFYFLDRPIANLANSTTISPTFEIGLLITILDMILFVIFGGISVYVAIRIWNKYD